MTQPKKCPECGTNHSGMYDVCYRCFDDDEIMSQPTQPNDDYVGPSESTKRLMLQPTSNEQLIDGIQEWSSGKKPLLPETIDICIRALLEENKRLIEVIQSYPPREKGADNEQG